MPVDPARAALVTQPFSRLVTELAGAPGAEEILPTAIAADAGAAAFAGRAAPLMRAGLAPLFVTVFDAAFDFEPGDVILLEAAGPKYVVTGVSDDPERDTATLTLRGPEPA